MGSSVRLTVDYVLDILGACPGVRLRNAVRPPVSALSLCRRRVGASPANNFWPVETEGCAGGYHAAQDMLGGLG
jgi:hypothetical protein